MSKRRPSDKKHLRQSIKRNQRNRTYKSQIRTALKEFEAIGGAEDRQKALPKVISAVDTAAAKGIYHPNKAARLKSRLSRQSAEKPAS